MNNPLRIGRASRRLSCLFRVIWWAIPLISIAVWLFINQLPEAMQKEILPFYVRLPLPALPRMLGFLVSWLPVGVAMYGVSILIRLFELYADGQIFRTANVRCFKKLSWALIGWCLAGILSRPLFSLALTAHHPPGQHILALSLGSPDLTVLLVGLVLAVIAWVMEEGRRLQEEQDLTV